MLSKFSCGVARRIFTFHVANATVTFIELDVWGVKYFEGHSSTVTAAFVQDVCTHDCTLCHLTPSMTAVFLSVNLFRHVLCSAEGLDVGALEYGIDVSVLALLKAETKGERLERFLFLRGR